MIQDMLIPTSSNFFNNLLVIWSSSISTCFINASFSFFNSFILRINYIVTIVSWIIYLHCNSFLLCFRLCRLDVKHQSKTLTKSIMRSFNSNIFFSKRAFFSFSKASSFYIMRRQYTIKQLMFQSSYLYQYPSWIIKQIWDVWKERKGSLFWLAAPFLEEKVSEFYLQQTQIQTNSWIHYPLSTFHLHFRRKLTQPQLWFSIRGFNLQWL